jgi:hypothetical protein
MFLSDVVMDSPVVKDSTSVVKKLLVAQKDTVVAAPSTSTVPPPLPSNNVPNTFPNYVLGRQQHQDGNSRNIVDLNTVPPPPFSSRSVTAMTADQVKMIKMMKATTNTELSPTSEKAIENQKMTSMNKKEATTKQSSRRDTSNHIITPSSATISALTAEIRSQAMKQEEEQQQKKQDEEKESSSSQPDDEKKAEKESSEPQDRSSSSSTTTTATKGLAQFASAMEASQTSQQNIHDWDKKFGLRRAHSKTMRESCRSRKKVLDFLKGEIKDGKGSVLSALLASSITSSSSSSSSTATTPLRESSATTATGTTTSDDVIDEKIDEMDEDSHMSNTENSVRKEEQGEGENDDGELEMLFRRASLDCVDDMLSKEQRSLLLLQKQHQASSRSTSDSSSDSKSSTANMLMHVMPPPQDTDMKQYHAKSA